MTENTIQEWIDKLPDYYIPANAGGIEADIQLHLTGDQGGDWWVTIHNGVLTQGKGEIPNPKLTLNGDGQDVLNVLTGQVDPMRAFMQGKIRVTGDMSLGMKLMNLFKQP